MKLTKRMVDLTGQQFGSLTAIAPHHKYNNMVYWEYRCKCGNTHIARGNTVKHQASKGDVDLPSCGCIELARKTRHGYRRANDTHPAYKAYHAIMNRCYNKNVSGYKWYGGSGVTICNEWKSDPEAFVNWAINNGWKEGLHIDKDILCDKLGISPHIYSPETCQWITAKINVGYATNRNNYGKHPNVRLSHADVREIQRLYHSGEETNMSQLARDFGLKSSSSIRRLVK